ENTKFTDLYSVSITSTISSRALDPIASVHIVTIADAYIAYAGGFQNSIIRLDEAEKAILTGNIVVPYSPYVPIEHFDFILLAESEHLDYQRWRPFLDYFDTFCIGIADGVSDTVLNFFKHNLVNDATQMNEVSQAELLAQKFQVLYALSSRFALYGENKPIQFLEQLTYLLFLKWSDIQIKLNLYVDRRISTQYAVEWRVLVNTPDDALLTAYTRTLQKLAQQPGLVGIIFLHAQHTFRDASSLRAFINELDDSTFWERITHERALSQAYEMLLSRVAEGDRRVNYFIPQTLAKTIIEVMRPDPEITICDPACGMGQFLIAAYNDIFNKIMKDTYMFSSETILRANDDSIYYGFEQRKDIARLCAMNLFLHNIGSKEGSRSPLIINDNFFSPPDEEFDM
ncbi:MAG: hypothetical protein M1835_003338, partial [Candelina submexicana]